MFWAMAFWMLGCGETTVQTHPKAASQTARAACKLFKGAEKPCKVSGSTLKTDAGDIGVDVVYTQMQSAMGSVSFQGVVKLNLKDQHWVMPIRGFGMNPDEALERGVHEWAVVSGVAVVDRVIDSPNLPALAAVDKDDVVPLVVPGRKAWRGWARLGGADPVDHQALVTGIAGLVSGKAVVSFSVTRELDTSLTVKAYVDGAESAAVADWLKTQKWKEKGVFEFRQTYLLE